MDLRVSGGKELARISRELRTVGNGREIRKQLGKELRTAALPLVPAVRASIQAIPAATGQSSGLRSRLAKATRLSVKTTGRTASIRILVDGRKMPDGERALPAYIEGTKPNWRHPVHGHKGTWVRQQAHPYFYKVVRPLGRKSRTAVIRTLDEISKKIS